MSLIKWKPLNNQIDTFDNVLDQFFNDFAFDPRFSLTTNQPYSYMTVSYTHLTLPTTPYV